ncbi:MAG: pre-peptidase C-terminal domain-containing protein [Phycisphaerae bacterium]|jgi:hypothetical protein|nr:pre-peptidase C-terminal domain-containing protein [Phycisphaerae bacterium]
MRTITLLLVLLVTLLSRTASAQIQLTNGVPLGGLGGSTGNEKLFMLSVPFGTSELVVETAGGDPDADIYLRWGAPPTINSFTYKSDGPSSNESITIFDPPGGNLYVMVRAHSSYAGVGIVGEYFGSDDVDVIELENEDSIGGLYGYTGDARFFKVSIPFNQDYARVKLTGSDPDADLYVRWGDLPSTEDYHAKSTGSSSNETIIIEYPPSGDLYILVYAYNGYFNATLSVDWDGPSGGEAAYELDNGVATGSFGGGQDSLRLFAIDVPADATSITFSMYGGWGDADLYLRWYEPPTLSEWDESPYANGNNESLTIGYPDAGTIYLLVHGYDDYGGVKLKVTYTAWTHFSHIHGPWKNEKIGTSTTKIKKDGSILASLSMALAYAGADVDPSTLNQWLKSHNGYKGSSTVKWLTAAQYDGPQGLDYIGPGSITTMAKLRQALDQGRIVLARSDRYDTTSHWVVIRHYTGNGSTWSKFHYWDPSDASPGIDRTLGDGWVGAGAKTRVYGISD